MPSSLQSKGHIPDSGPEVNEVLPLTHCLLYQILCGSYDLPQWPGFWFFDYTVVFQAFVLCIFGVLSWDKLSRAFIYTNPPPRSCLSSNVIFSEKRQVLLAPVTTWHIALLCFLQSPESQKFTILYIYCLFPTIINWFPWKQGYGPLVSVKQSPGLWPVPFAETHNACDPVPVAEWAWKSMFTCLTCRNSTIFYSAGKWQKERVSTRWC